MNRAELKTDPSPKKRTVKHLSEQYTLLDTITLDHYKEQMAALERRKRRTAAALRTAPGQSQQPAAPDEPPGAPPGHARDARSPMDGGVLDRAAEPSSRTDKPSPPPARSSVRKPGPEPDSSAPHKPVIIVDSQGRASIPGQRIVRYLSGEYTLLDMYSFDSYQEDMARRGQATPSGVPDSDRIIGDASSGASPVGPMDAPTIMESGRTMKILSSEYTVLDILRVDAVRAGTSSSDLSLMQADDGPLYSHEMMPLDGYPIEPYRRPAPIPLPSDAELHQGYFAFLRELALDKLRKMVVELDRHWANEMRDQEVKIARENRIIVIALTLSAIAVLALLIFGLAILQQRTWPARFYLQSAWANEEGTVRVIVDAKGLTPEEKYDQLDEISAQFEIGPKTVGGSIMPIYLKTEEVLFVIQSQEPIAMPGPCELNVHLSRKAKKTVRTVAVSNLKYEVNPGANKQKSKKEKQSPLEKDNGSWPDKGTDTEAIP